MTTRRYLVFGTAGHVDHGKSTLVEALTGTNPDRLPEERTREMTIDLGFAFLSLPGIDDFAAIVDVPGHEMFVRNMVAGATGIDAALLVVAADEGIMPQTLEHFEVLRQLHVSTTVIAITKVDRVSPERVANVTAEVRELISEVYVGESHIVPVSAKTGEGLDSLRETIAHVATQLITRSSEGLFRLPIDRVFTLQGVGTVVTGTVIAGALGVGETVVCLPQNRSLRVRSLHVHDRPVERVFAGQRSAINLANITKEELARGDVLTTPGALSASLMMDVRLNLSPLAPKAIEQRTRVRVHHGTREVMARVVLLEGEKLLPGESALAQLRLEAALVAAPDDLFVIRSYSPMLVIGGGIIIDPHPPKRKRSHDVAQIERRESSKTEQVTLNIIELANRKGVVFADLTVRVGVKPEALDSILKELKNKGEIHEARQGRWLSISALENMGERIVACLAKLHRDNPLRTTVPLSALTAELSILPDERECLQAALMTYRARGTIKMSGDRIQLTSHSPHWDERSLNLRELLIRNLREQGLAPPASDDLAVSIGASKHECQAILDALLDSGELMPLSLNLVLLPEIYISAREKVRRFLISNGSLNIAQARDLLGLSRKYLLPLLEALDREGLTARKGDHRVLAVRNNR